jgi:alpha,alpha-trehalase
MLKPFYILVFSFLVVSCGNNVKKKEYTSPDKTYGKLFHDVQMSGIFSSSKTFSDAVPLYRPNFILEEYDIQKKQPDFQLSAFLKKHFSIDSLVQPTNAISLDEYLKNPWKSYILDPKDDGGSLFPPRKTYAVAQPNRKDLFYAESYATMRGLYAAGRTETAENMVLNYAQFIQDFGYIPTANRSYYFGHSQLPYFSMMVRLLATLKKDEQELVLYLPQLQKEYQYWMSSTSIEESKEQENARKEAKNAFKRVFFMNKTLVLNRYFSVTKTPRPDAYKEDVMLQKANKVPAEIMYPNLWASTESGWKTMTRWQKNDKIRTLDIAPVDLNALLYHLEITIAAAYEAKKQPNYAKSMRTLAEHRKTAFSSYFWNETQGFFVDYDAINKKQSEHLTLAAVYPLWVKLATAEQAKKVAQRLEKDFLKTEGLISELGSNRYQPDLQLIAVEALTNYGYTALAQQIRERWTNAQRQKFEKSGQFSEVNAQSVFLVWYSVNR